MTRRSDVENSATGRQAEFDVWVAPHLPVLRRYAVLVDPGHDPDDLVQDVLVRAWTKWETYSPQRGSPRTWLIALVSDKARRRRARAPKPTLVPLDPSTPGRESDPADRLDVRRAIAGLPARQRQAVLLFYYVDLNVEDVATAMGCTPGTVKSTLSDARRRLATMLEELA